MNNWKKFESDTIKLISEQLEAAGFETVIRDGPDKNVQALISGMPTLGEAKLKVNLEIYFLPVDENNRNHMEYNYLQFFVAIRNDINENILKDMLAFINTVNSTLPIGSFSVLVKDELLFYKYCCAIAHNMNEDNIKAVIDADVAIIINILNVYIDVLLDLAEGKTGGNVFPGTDENN